MNDDIKKIQIRNHKKNMLHMLVEEIEGFIKYKERFRVEYDWRDLDGLTPKFRIDYLNFDDTISPKDLPRLTITLEEE